MLGDRDRAAAISSRPTWAMNTTAGSAARAGVVASATHRARNPKLRQPAQWLAVLQGRQKDALPIDMRCLPLVALARRQRLAPPSTRRSLCKPCPEPCKE